jgi:hypothetical protein
LFAEKKAYFCKHAFLGTGLLGVRGTRCTHLSKSMPYRDPAQRAAWMREYRRRKRGIPTSAPVSLRTPLSVPRATEPSNIARRIIETPGLQPAPANTGFVRKSARSSFKTALQLARTFPFGVLAFQACPYCYNTGYSSPGTRCSYCRSRGR